MSVNIFGFRSAIKQRSVDNSKFISLTKNLQTRVDKGGDIMTGTLTMKDNKITSSFIPDADDVVTNKAYVDSKLCKSGDTMNGVLNMNRQQIKGVQNPTDDDDVCNKQYTDTLINTKLDRDIEHHLDMNGFKITNIKNPEDPFDAVNKSYVEIALQRDDIDLDNLLSIGTFINTILTKYENVAAINKYREGFRQTIHYLDKMDEKCTEIFEKELQARAIFELLRPCSLYSDFKVLIVQIIEDMPKNIFLELKDHLTRQQLILIPEGGSLCKRYRRIIKEFSEDIDPSKFNDELRLLIQKNKFLLDIGFIYLNKNLLKQLLDLGRS